MRYSTGVTRRHRLHLESGRGRAREGAGRGTLLEVLEHADDREVVVPQLLDDLLERGDRALELDNLRLRVQDAVLDAGDDVQGVRGVRRV